LTSGYWFQYLENKIAGYILSLTENVPAPEIFCCVTNVSELSPCLSNYFNKASIGGIVVKATSLHSSTGVFVLLPDPVGPDPLDLITGTHVSLDDIVTQLSVLQVTTIIVEQFIGKDLPTEYKFHVVNGTVAAIDVISGRGTDCPCYAVRDVDWNPLDKFGCFEPSGIELVNPGSQCTAIDFPTGLAKKGPVKKDLYLCVDLEEPEPCVLQEMIDIAIKLGSRIGVYVRIDMFAVGDRVYVQEYSTNHMNGIRHCAAKQDEFGCIDSCFLGRLWNAAGGPFGGVQTQVPPILSEFDEKSAKDQCSLLDQKPISYYTPKC
jgi:TupA-like ATPgrasp